MNIPRFNAESSLYRTTLQYCGTVSGTDYVEGQAALTASTNYAQLPEPVPLCTLCGAFDSGVCCFAGEVCLYFGHLGGWGCYTRCDGSLCPRGYYCDGRHCWKDCPGGKTRCRFGKQCCRQPYGRYDCIPRDSECCKNGHDCPKGKHCCGPKCIDDSDKCCPDGSTCGPGQKCCGPNNGKYFCCPGSGNICTHLTDYGGWSCCFNGQTVPDPMYGLPCCDGIFQKC